jgi:hypothetical protein
MCRPMYLGGGWGELKSFGRGEVKFSRKWNELDLNFSQHTQIFNTCHKSSICAPPPSWLFLGKCHPTLLPVCTSSCAYWVWDHWWLLNVSFCYRFTCRSLRILNLILNTKKQRDMQLYRSNLLLPSFRTKFTTNFARRTKTGYRFMSSYFVTVPCNEL